MLKRTRSKTSPFIFTTGLSSTTPVSFATVSARPLGEDDDL